MYLGPNLELMQVDILHFREFRDGQNVGELYIFFEKMLAFQIVRILDKTYIEYMHIITE